MDPNQFTCGRCGELHAAEQYPPSQRHNGGYCRPCKQAYEKAHPRKRYKPGRKFSETCYKCGMSRAAGDHAHIGYCGDCFRAYNRERYRVNGPKISTHCTICGIPRTDGGKHSSYCPRCLYIYSLKRKYGLGVEDYQFLLEGQAGGCAICGKSQSQQWKAGWNHPLEVDHCHDTGRVRGLLCSSCNVSLGRFKHDPAILRRAADYLERS